MDFKYLSNCFMLLLCLLLKSTEATDIKSKQLIARIMKCCHEVYGMINVILRILSLSYEAMMYIVEIFNLKPRIRL